MTKVMKTCDRYIVWLLVQLGAESHFLDALIVEQILYFTLIWELTLYSVTDYIHNNTPPPFPPIFVTKMLIYSIFLKYLKKKKKNSWKTETQREQLRAWKVMPNLAKYKALLTGDNYTFFFVLIKYGISQQGLVV